MKISESAVGSEILGNIKGCASDATKILGLKSFFSRPKPKKLIRAVDDFIYNWQKGVRPPIHPDEDLSLVMGSLWGEQLVRDLGWQWAGVTFHEHGDTKAVGVFSPDRALAIYPFQFVQGCLENRATVTIMLSYNMLKDGSRIPSLPPRGYMNMMDSVQHIIPRG